MPSFDANSFLVKSNANPTNNLLNFQQAFGVPECMYSLMQNPAIVALMPSPVLTPSRVLMSISADKSRTAVNKIARWIKYNLGISIFPDRNGDFGFFSEINKWGLELGNSKFLLAVESFMKDVREASAEAGQSRS